jgi:hypothetical protein
MHRHALRNYPGEREGKIVTDWLNQKAKPQACCALVVDFVLLNRNGDGYRNVARVPKPVPWMRQYLPEWAINMRSFDWNIENDAPGAYQALVQRGLFRRIRKCRKCGRFFYARFKRQWFCGETCQKSYWQSSEFGKGRHCEHSKRNRERLQLRDELTSAKGARKQRILKRLKILALPLPMP